MPFLKIKNVLVYFFILNVHILSSEDSCFTITLAPKLKVTFFVKASFSIKDHSIMSFSHLLFLQKSSIIDIQLDSK